MNDVAVSEQALLARNLKRARDAAGLSQIQLAERAGLDRSYLLKLESGRANPSLLKLVGLATALNTTVIDLLTHPGAPQADKSAAPLPASIDAEAVLQSVIDTLRAGGAVG